MTSESCNKKKAAWSQGSAKSGADIWGKSLDKKRLAWEWYERMLEVPSFSPSPPQLRMGEETGWQKKQQQS